MVSNFVRQFYVKNRLLPGKVVAAASGGTDSTALLLALADLREEGLEVVCAHVNHHLRGAESDADQAFVEELCSRLRVPFAPLDGTIDPGVLRHRGLEAAARQTRYGRLASFRRESGADHVATGHQKDDQAETVLMRLLHGGGLASFRGIHPIREDGVVRPLLGLTRAQLAAFLGERGVTARHDRSNDDRRFLRNRVRAMLAGSAAIDPLAAFADAMQRAWPRISSAIDAEESLHAEVLPDETRFLSWPDDAWMCQALLHRHIARLEPSARDVSADDLERMAAGLATLRRLSITGGLELVRRADGTVSLRRRPDRPAAFELPLAPGEPAEIVPLGLTFHLAPAPPHRNPRDGGRQLIEVPREDGAFTVRSRRVGDRFHPLGLAEPKKLKDFLIGRKIPAEERDRLPLLLWNSEIAWVAGVEVSERFKVTGRGGVLYEVWTEGAGAADVGYHSGVHR